MSVLSFLGNTFIAYRIVTEGQFPDAKLYEMNASFDPPKPNGSTKIEDLNKLRGVFSATQNGTFGTVFINSTTWGEWAAPTFIGQPWLEDQPIPMPDEKYMEPQKAHQRLIDNGYPPTFLGLTFRKPLYPGVDEPKWIFAMPDGPYLLVGAISGKIESSEGSDLKATGSLESDA